MLTLTLRVLTAVAVLVSALIHLQVWFEGFRAIPVIGSLFLLNVVGGVLIGVAVLAWRHWLPLLASVGFGVTTLAAYYVSATVGLFSVHETWSGSAVVGAEISEIVAVAAGLAAIALLSRRHRAPVDHVVLRHLNRRAS